MSTRSRGPERAEYGGSAVGTGNGQATLLNHYPSIGHREREELPFDYAYSE